MRTILVNLSTLLCLFFLFANKGNTQSCIPTNISGAVINRSCGQFCADINFQIPHIKGTDDYVINSIPYNPYPYTITTSNELTSIYTDDNYSPAQIMPFAFCFYGTVYDKFVAGSNGLITFDIANAAPCGNSYNQDFPIPYASGNICSGGSAYYPKASIMGIFTDLYPVASACPGDRKIAWHTEGTAPCRKLVMNYYHVGMYGNGVYSNGGTNCNSQNPTTFQIVLYESTGVIDVNIVNKGCNATAGTGYNAILGIQDFTRTKAVAAPGKNATIWNESNKAYRFTPSGGLSRFVSSELLTMTGASVAMADTVTTLQGLLDVKFPNVCVASASTRFVIKTTFSACDNPSNQLIGYDTISVNLTQMQADAVPVSPTCSSATNGSIIVTPTTGTAPYIYSLDGGMPVTSSTPYTFTNTPTGSHTIIVQDVFGCVTPAIPVDVVNGPPITTTAAKTDALCNGSNTGSITVAQPAVGTAPFEYSLNGTVWQTSPVFSGLAAGTYTVYYRESNGCQNTLPITVSEPASLISSLSSVPVVCNGQNNGTITVAANGGVMPYEYSINASPWQSSNSFNVSAGTYSIIVKDANGCMRPQSITVSEPPALNAVSLNTNASCNGGNDGTIAVTANGGNSNYTYSVDGTSFQPSNQFYVAPGTYTVTVKDNLGCKASFPAIVGLTNNLTFIPQTDPVICESKSVQLKMFSNATNYSWSPVTALSDTLVSNPVANPVVTTQYIVNFTLGRCTKADTVIVNVNKAPVPDAGADGFICYGQNYQLSANGGTQYKWSPATYLDNANIKTPLSTPIKDVVYTLSVLSDVNGCASLVTDSMLIDVTPPIKVKTFPFDTVVYHTDQFPILAIPSDTDVIYYSWSPSMGLSNPNIPNPVATMGATTFSPTFGSVGDEIFYQITASTIAGCKGEGYVRVKIYKGPDIYIPTAFSPNGDGKNDKLVPFPVGIKTLNYFRVYNRWGQMMFSTTKLHDGWDGTLSGTRQQTGSFVWIAEAITEQDKVITKKGVVTLVR